MHTNDVDGTNISSDILQFINLKYAPFQRMDPSLPPSVPHRYSHVSLCSLIHGADTELFCAAECTRIIVLPRTAVLSSCVISASEGVND
jgi:hypothetical protein